MSIGIALVLAKAAVVAPTDSCAARAGAVNGAGAKLPAAVPGASLKNAGALERMRKSAKDGRVILIDGGDFTNWDFSKRRLAAICFRGSKMAGSKWRGALAPGIGFFGSDLSNAALAGASMPGVIFRTSTLAKADASNADFHGGIMDGGWDASLAGWKIDGANLSGFRFQCGVTQADGCPFDRQGISAVGTNFAGAVFVGFSVLGSALKGARFDDAEMAPEDIGQITGAAPPVSLVMRIGARRAQIPASLIPAIARLASPVTNQIGLAPAPKYGNFLFLHNSLKLPLSTSSDPSWAQIVGVMTRLAPSYLLVRIGRNRQAVARGISVSGTASCTLETGRLPQVGTSFVTLPNIGKGRALPVLRITGDQASLDPAQENGAASVRVARCTGPAPFGTMQRVPVDDLTFEALWSAAGRPPE